VRRAGRRATAAGGALLTAAAVALLGASAASAATGFQASRTVTRQFLNPDGSETVVDTRHFSVNVDTISDLRGRQQITVAWSGAHPTGGLVADPNSAAASRQEYPVVLMECRGIDSPAAPAGQRVDPSTCWTQTPDERYQETFFDPNDVDIDPNVFPEWRLDQFAPAAQRTAVVNPPTGADCSDGAGTRRYTPFVATTGVTYFGGANGLCGIPPEASTTVDPSAPPADTTYGATGLDGTGRASFVVWTAQQNASLGCSNTVPCALVIIPIVGISCDASGTQLPAGQEPAPGDQATGAVGKCEKTGRYAPGEPFSSGVDKGFGDSAVVGALWWSASNWNNRISVPLSFAPAPNACDVLDNRPPLDIYGSELMNQATIQWAALFCHDPRLFKFQHVRTGEPQAKSALAAGTISAALVSRPPDGGYTGPTVNAPVAVTGFAISFVADDANKKPVATLKLNPRLLAKLLSESYWGRLALQQDYHNLGNSNPYKKLETNPQDITRDPEFVKLNPGIGPTIQTQAASTLLVLSGNSDVMYALTSYINADPDARAFLNGKPDPWGMVVNPAYKGISLPQPDWPLLDTFLSPDIDLDGCLRNDKQQIVPVPILPLIAAPMASLTSIAQSMQFAIANSNTNCSPLLTPGGLIVGGTLKPLGREQPGARFMLGLTALGDSDLYGLHSATLQSSPGHFVAPTNAGMSAAMKLTSYDPGTRTWPIPYSKLRGSAGSGAYPGTMVVYAAVPTTGLDATTARDLGELLDFTSSAGQRSGTDQGQLPPGFLPMTSANGLGALAARTEWASGAVSRQAGELIPTGPVSTPNPHPTPTATHQPGGGQPGGGGTGTPTGTPSTTRPAGAEPPPSPYHPPVDVPAGYVAAIDSRAAGWALPVGVLITIGATIIAIIFRTVSSVRASNNLRNRLIRLSATKDIE